MELLDLDRGPTGVLPQPSSAHATQKQLRCRRSAALQQCFRKHTQLSTARPHRPVNLEAH
jgi:hypothetical protein